MACSCLPRGTTGIRDGARTHWSTRIRAGGAAARGQGTARADASSPPAPRPLSGQLGTEWAVVAAHSTRNCPLNRRAGTSAGLGQPEGWDGRGRRLGLAVVVEVGEHLVGRLLDRGVIVLRCS